MTKKATAKKRAPEDIIAEQKEQAKKLKATLPVVSAATPALPDSRNAIDRYLDEIAPPFLAGRMIKFSKDGKFVFADTDEAITPATEFVALVGETLVGWIKFFHDGETPPERHQGLLFDGFEMPPRQTLGELDHSEWPEGLSGKPEDPWKHQMCLVLQRIDTQELATFVTTNITGRNAVGSLIRHYKRLQKTNPGEQPLVRLQAGGFNHRDPRVGWVPVPQFSIVGHVPQGSAAKPDIASDLNDEIPHLGSKKTG